jgi:hypothetical protein
MARGALKSDAQRDIRNTKWKSESSLAKGDEAAKKVAASIPKGLFKKGPEFEMAKRKILERPYFASTDGWGDPKRFRGEWVSELESTVVSIEKLKLKIAENPKATVWDSFTDPDDKEYIPATQALKQQESLKSFYLKFLTFMKPDAEYARKLKKLGVL